ncbi:retrovirus-related pol polyprotein from transposon TNT 1-94 [Tanacetum coccineum]
MDLCGPIRVASVNGKKYILIIVDDYSRFTWVKCLRSKVEAPYFIIKFLKMIQVRLKTHVRRIRTDNGTEFVNQTLREYYEKVGISHETSVAPSPYSSGPALHEITPATISSGLVPNPPTSTPFVPPSRNDWDLLFQLLFDKLLNPPSSVDRPAPKVIALIAKVVAPVPAASTGSPSSTTVDQDAPSPKNDSEASSSSDVIPTVVHTATPNLEHEEHNEFERLEVWELVPYPYKVMVITLKWIYKVKLDELGVARLDAIRIFLVYAAHMNMIVYQMDVKTIFCVKKFIIIEKYGMKSSDPVDTPMVEKSKLDEDTQRKAMDPTHYRRMIGTLMYLTASRPDLTFAVCMCARYQAKPTEKHLHAVKIIFKYLRRSGDRLVSWSSKRQKSATISSMEDEYIALSGCCAQVLWMRSQLTDYGLRFNKILMYCDNKSAIALCCNNVQHSRSKHIDIRFHFIKEQVENGVVELYFVNTEYQLVNIFTKALSREKLNFLSTSWECRVLRWRL